MELMTLDTVRLRKKVGSMKAPGRWGWGENGFGGESAWRFNASKNSRRALKRRTELPAPDLRLGSPDTFPQSSSFPRAEHAFRVGCFSVLDSRAHSPSPPPASPSVSRRASTRKRASSWMRFSMLRLPTPKFFRVVMEKRRSCLARSPLLKITPGEEV